MPSRVEIFDKNWRIAWLALLAIVLVLIVLIRIRLLNIPLERDEGEYAYASQLMLQGIPPYRMAYNMKFPGTYAAYALLMSIFGQNIAGIHLGLLVVNMATIALIFLIGTRLVSTTAGSCAAASYAILSVSPSVLGCAGHATHFAVLMVLGGALLLLRPLQPHPKKIVFLSGVLFGLGLLMKQPAFFFIPFGAMYLFYRDWRASLDWKQILIRNAIFIVGSALPFGVTCLLLWWAGVFGKFWFWTLIYAREYGGLVPFALGVRTFFENITGVIGSGWALWTMAGLGIVACLFDKRLRGCAIFLLGFLAFSGFALLPGFYFRRHYFIVALPAICLLAGAAVASAENLCIRHFRSLRFILLALFGVALALPVLAAKPFFFAPTPIAACRRAYGLNPFPEAVRIAEYLREHTDANDKIAVLGSEPEIYFYARRLSATGYIYTYELMEPHRYALQMQRELIREIEFARPKYIVFFTGDASWLRRPKSEELIFDWFGKYSAENYSPAGLVNIVSPERTDYYFPAPRNPESIQLSSNYVLIYMRKS